MYANQILSIYLFFVQLIVQVISASSNKNDPFIRVNLSNNEYYMNDIVTINLINGMTCNDVSNKEVVLYGETGIYVTPIKVTCGSGNEIKAQVPTDLGENERFINHFIFQFFAVNGNVYRTSEFTIIKTTRPSNKNQKDFNSNNDNNNNNNSSKNQNDNSKNNKNTGKKSSNTTKVASNNSNPSVKTAVVSNGTNVVKDDKVVSQIHDDSNPAFPIEEEEEEEDIDNKVPTKNNNVSGSIGSTGNFFNGDHSKVNTKPDNNKKVDEKESKDGPSALNIITFIIIFLFFVGVIIIFAKIYRSKKRRNTLNFKSAFDDNAKNEVPFPTFIPSKVIDTDRYIQID